MRSSGESILAFEAEGGALAIGCGLVWACSTSARWARIKEVTNVGA